MDPLNVFAEGQEAKISPSQDLQHLMKSDRESLDDFEHVNKDAHPAADSNLQFINFEKGQTEIEQALKEGDRKPSPTFSSGKSSPEQIGAFSSVADVIKPAAPLIDDTFGSSKNFMQYEKHDNERELRNDDLDDFLRGGPQRTNEAHDDSDQSQGDDDDDSIVTPAPVKAQPKAPTPEPVKPATPEPPKKVVEEKPLTPEPVVVKPPSPIQVREPTPPPAVKVEEPVPQRPAPKIPEHKIVDAEENLPPPVVPRDYPEIGVLEPREILNACGLYTLFHPERLNPKVEALVYWRDPKKSGIVFGSVMVVLLSLTIFSFISVLAYTSLFALIAAISFRIYKSVLQAVQKTSEGHPFNTYLLPALQQPLVSAVFETIQEYLEIDLTLSPERVREVTDVGVAHINSSVAELRRRFLVEDIVDSVKFGLLLYVLTYVGQWFNGLTLIILSFVALFTLPKVYENNQAQIDANLDLVRGKINEVTDKIKAVIPIGKKSEEAKDKNE